MNIVATQIRVGNVLNLEGELYRVTWTQHVTPGKGVACMQTKLKNIINGKNLEKRFRSADKVEKASLDGRSMQYLYDDGEGYVFMDDETFEQTSVSKELVGDGGQYLAPETSYTVTFYEGQPVGVDLPTSIELEVISAPPVIKKATASATLRPVTLENEMVVQAPSFIKEGDRIKISTDTGEYLERVK